MTAGRATASRPSLRLRLAARYGPRGGALYAFGAGAAAIAVAGLAAAVFHQALLFPSLGPSVFLFVEAPLGESASVRNTLVGHLIGLVFGLAALAALGLWSAPSVLQEGVSPARIAAAALAVAATSAALVWLRMPHPPAGATTLIVALGLITGTRAAVLIPAGVMLVTVVAWLVNRSLGEPVAVWFRAGGEPVASSLRGLR